MTREGLTWPSFLDDQMLTEPIKEGVVYKTRDGRMATVLRFYPTHFYERVNCTMVVDMILHGEVKKQSWTCWADGKFPGRGTETSEYPGDIVDFWEPPLPDSEQLDLFL